MKPVTLEDFLKPAWKGKIASTPYAAGFDILLGRGRLGQGEDRQLRARACRSRSPASIRCGEAERIATGEYLALVMDCTGQDALAVAGEGRAARPDDAARRGPAALLLLCGAQERAASRTRAKLYCDLHA